LKRARWIAYATLAVLAVYLLTVEVIRMREGRCLPGGRRGALDCSHTTAR
jgi:hypothetical protein